MAWLVHCSLLLLIAVLQTNANIYFKRTTEYVKIYTDAGTGADSDVSIWRPDDNESGFYAVGDVAVSTHSKPQVSAIMVKDQGNGLVSTPASFSEIWNDRGSGGRQDVRVMRMNPRSGYKCIGTIAVIGYSSYPDRNKYRCVKSSYVTRGRYELIWKDSGSGANRDVAFWTVRRDYTNTYGVEGNTFAAFATHRRPTGGPYVLNGKYAKSHLDLGQSNENIAITIYKQTDLDIIWKDTGSGGRYDFSIWRPKGPSGTFSLSDVGVSHYSKPVGFVAKAVKSDALRPPVSFHLSWKDRGSGASWDGSFWEPVCPYGYRPLGFVSMRNYNRPSADSIRCVKAEYTVPGTWQWIWNDLSTGSDWDCGAWRAMSRNSGGQRIGGTSTVRSHGSMNRPAFVLKASVVNYSQGKPVKRYYISNVQYQLQSKDKYLSEPESLAYTSQINKGDTVQKFTRTVQYSYSESKSFTSSFGMEFGVQTEFEAGLPLIAKSTVTVSVKTSFSLEWGKTTTTTKTDSIAVELTVKGHSQKSAVITGSRYKMDVPYTATLKTEYMDGTTGTNSNFKGVFKGVQVFEVQSVVEPDVPI